MLVANVVFKIPLARKSSDGVKLEEVLPFYCTEVVHPHPVNEVVLMLLLATLALVLLHRTRRDILQALWFNAESLFLLLNFGRLLIAELVVQAQCGPTTPELAASISSRLIVFIVVGGFVTYLDAVRLQTELKLRCLTFLILYFSWRLVKCIFMSPLQRKDTVEYWLWFFPLSLNQQNMSGTFIVIALLLKSRFSISEKTPFVILKPHYRLTGKHMSSRRTVNQESRIRSE